LSVLSAIEYPHWLMIGGHHLVAFGFIGFENEQPIIRRRLLAARLTLIRTGQRADFRGEAFMAKTQAAPHTPTGQITCLNVPAYRELMEDAPMPRRVEGRTSDAHVSGCETSVSA
jgi:hypothetical protein